MPSVDDLKPYVEDRKMASKRFGVTEKTILRWLRYYGLADEEIACRAPKLDMIKAIEIRKLHSEGKTMKDLANIYGVTFSSISRIVHNIVYRQEKEIADVKVIYNPDGHKIFVTSDIIID
jgi:transposase